MKKIKIKNSIFEAYLGVSELERALPQKISLDLSYFYKDDQRCTDNINNLLCYDVILNKVRRFLSDQQFKTVEYLTEEVYFLLKGSSDLIENLKVTVKKMNPPITGGISADAVVVKIGGK